jgi:hypothetical protein
MPYKIGPRRLQHLLDAGVNLHQLPRQQQFEAARTVARLMTQPSGYTPKRLRPRCGARCRNGGRCKAPVVWDQDYNSQRNGRCRIHGGLSTGPRTPEGRRRIGMANRQRAQARRLAKAQAAAQASALAAYRQAVAKYEALCQHPVPDPRFKAALLQVQGREVERRYQACLDCGADPRADERNLATRV